MRAGTGVEAGRSLRRASVVNAASSAVVGGGIPARLVGRLLDAPTTAGLATG